VDDLYTLEDLSRRLGNIPISTLKHRIQQLGLPAAARGSRNKLLFDAGAIAVLEAADGLIRDGHGIHSVRKVLKLEDAAPAPAPADAPVDGDASIAGELAVLTAVVPAASAPAAVDGEALDRLSRSLEHVLEQLALKDRQLEQLQQELRHAQEAAATFQQKTFYLQGELQRIQGDLREARRAPAADVATGLNLGIGPLPWKRLWKKDT
jgi:DNA-binding transcriptional MerR regulator